ncbi:hypothetical protein [Pollutibacter soli]|uniref:hypothetical protein n=1 Tax=Pollutibacter soli TaxID=3034157 RepID=UPI0030135427
MVNLSKKLQVDPITGVPASFRLLPSIALYSAYKLVIFPEGDGGARIRDLAKSIKGNSPSGMNILARPYIEVASFEGRELMEDTLIRWIQRVCNSHNRFDLQLNNFGSHPNHPLYLRVMNPEPVTKLINSMQVIENYIVTNGSGYLKWTKKPVCFLTNGESRREWTDFIRQQLSEDFFDSFTVYNLVLIKLTGAGDASEEIVNVFPLYP